MPALSTATTSSTGVAIPIRGFVDGKSRLADRLDADARAQLVAGFATAVVQAARTDGLPVVIITSAPEVVAWAGTLGVDVIADEGSLDAAAAAGQRWAREHGLARVVVTHSDLPLVTTFAPMLDVRGAAVGLAPCRREDGTNAITLPVDLAFRFAYGPNSFARHRAVALDAGAILVVVRDRAFAFDVDEPRDLDDLVALGTPPAPTRVAP
jgi:2-phospho-L-lactate guanylyltransferase